MAEFNLDDEGNVIEAYALDNVLASINRINLSVINETRLATIIEMLRKCYDEDVLPEKDHKVICDILGR